MKRRNFANLLLGTSFLGTMASLLYPVIRYILPPKQPEISVSRVKAANVGELAPNTAKTFRFGNEPGLLINTSSGDLLAFSAVCTHLTCNVRYEPETEIILCPCHNGRFDLSGNVISGPPPAPLESFQVEISGNGIFISKK